MAKAEKRKYEKHTIDHEKFVVAWQKHNSVQEVADAFGIDRKVASLLAGKLRKLGVGLVKYKTKTGISDEEIKKLKELAKKAVT